MGFSETSIDTSEVVRAEREAADYGDLPLYFSKAGLVVGRSAAELSIAIVENATSTSVKIAVICMADRCGCCASYVGFDSADMLRIVAGQLMKAAADLDGGAGVQ